MEPLGLCNKPLAVVLLELPLFYRVQGNKKNEGERVLGEKLVNIQLTNIVNIQLTKREGNFIMHPVKRKR